MQWVRGEKAHEGKSNSAVPVHRGADSGVESSTPDANRGLEEAQSLLLKSGGHFSTHFASNSKDIQIPINS